MILEQKRHQDPLRDVEKTIPYKLSFFQLPLTMCDFGDASSFTGALSDAQGLTLCEEAFLSKYQFDLSSSKK